MVKNTRVYVIADIHGRADLLGKLLKAIVQDARGHKAAHCLLITLGDYIDRGPESREVIELLTHFSSAHFKTKYLCGNHEKMLMAFLDDPKQGLAWLSNGGWATLLSYGFSAAELPDTLDDLPMVRNKMLLKMPRSHLAFMIKLELSYQWGDYFFVHAGVRPTVPLNRQQEDDLLWIRKEFLSSHKQLPKIIVHGHTIVSKPEIKKNRIALDTGAFYSGKLTCLVLAENEQYFLQAEQGSVHINKFNH